jgi:hypothetical protein
VFWLDISAIPAIITPYGLPGETNFLETRLGKPHYLRAKVGGTSAEVKMVEPVVLPVSIQNFSSI